MKHWKEINWKFIWNACSWIFLVASLVLALGMYNTYAGKYIPPGDLIIIRADNEYQLNLYIASHEFAHKTYYKDLTSYERAEWKALFKANNQSVSLYGQTNEEEDFAETIAYNVKCEFIPPVLEDKNKEAFINKTAHFFNEVKSDE